MAGYYAKRTFGGYGVYDADGKEIEIIDGQGSKLRAEQRAAELNGDEKITEIEGEADTEDYVRGSAREGRGR